MYYRTIDNCPLTKKSSFVTYPYVDNKEYMWYNMYGGYHTGIDILCDTVYSICKGVVAAIGQYEDTDLYVVTVQYDSDRCVRYGHLSEVNVTVGQLVEYDIVIGTVYHHLHFEYITTSQYNSMWPVRVLNKEYYKQDPESIADGSYILPSSGFENVVVITDEDVIPEFNLTKEMIKEFSDNL